ncbi:MAG: type II toxin-antitoxin system VapB family antitoxin [Dehalococcoidia bacterium]
MKTTVEIDDDLLKEAKKRAVDEGITMRTLIEQALKSRLESPGRERHPLADWGTPGNAGREVLYDETYNQILDDIEAAMRRYDERMGRS